MKDRKFKDLYTGDLGAPKHNNCDDDCECGCHDGAEFDCECDDDCECGCHDGAECDCECDDDCECGCHDGAECDCECDDDCKCGCHENAHHAQDCDCDDYDCGDDTCDLDPTKICDNCGQCLEFVNVDEKGYASIGIDGVSVEGVTLDDLYHMYGLDKDEE